ncbi:MAG: hypothetical protein A3G57_02600 [Candidatus Andersenbacteria bacterium RIFCSPLOWO2_12_FULL_45_8]|nr:MAG: hypothetical protein UW94_C0016G0012 [Parcubacteria group bacterium GW2011_GWA2_45_14]OGY33948.1 MAG: hypothetical protein A3B76_02105 [Candidatus Andersenbacteria bacterium RIFCSPHIGHO2_02_FULL_46_16]OGY37945.1 MAG: hypothetical protein A3I08_02820 [Candidatus Andersenbacteria bacterium RIFCSPLOWO2_02_FULL_46_11]OGY38368.1 MAG: hypothetical protein A3G57_02600 [Candidatus Andersenbacteria bacterium RIFCSPLOWO2_12_FULL_45_8]HBE90266.1 hypothetical protein [Candidatus Andersenbacteria ba
MKADRECVLLVVLILVLIIPVFVATRETPVSKEKDLASGDMEWANCTVGEIRYIYEPRTGLCFAYISEYNSSSIAVVPYEQVEKFLLNPPEASPTMEAEANPPKP